METPKKITIQIPESLLKQAQKATGLGITPTIRQGLQLVAPGRAYGKLRQLRGKIKFSLDLKALRKDRACSRRATATPISAISFGTAG